jgi:membrane protein required for colicin V production
MPFTAIDIIIFAFMLLSGLLALLRGFVREVVTIVTWVGSAFVALHTLTILGPFMHDLITKAWLADVVTFSIPFFLMLYFMTWLGNKVILKLSGKEPGPVDGTVGFFFGIGRGFIIVTIAYFVFDLLYDPKTSPEWIVDSQFEPVIADTTEFYYSLFPTLKAKPEPVKGAVPKKDGKSGKDKGDPKREKGYSERDREAIDQLFKDSGGG